MVDLRPYEKLHSIQLLRSVLRKWWKVELAFADATGYVIDHAEGRLAPPNNELCAIALSSKEGFKRCNESLRHARDEARAPRRARRAVIHECHLGFDVVACPIVFDGEAAGMLFVGGTIHEPLSTIAESALLSKVRDLGAAPQKPSDPALPTTGRPPDPPCRHPVASASHPPSFVARH